MPEMVGHFLTPSVYRADVRRHFAFIAHTGSPRRGSLLTVRSRLQPQRVCLFGLLHPGGPAGDPREHRTGRDQHLYHNPFNGHEVSTYR